MNDLTLTSPTERQFIQDNLAAFYEMLLDTNPDEFVQALKEGNAALGRLFTQRYYDWRSEVEEQSDE